MSFLPSSLSHVALQIRGFLFLVIVIYVTCTPILHINRYIYVYICTQENSRLHLVWFVCICFQDRHRDWVDFQGVCLWRRLISQPLLVTRSSSSRSGVPWHVNWYCHFPGLAEAVVCWDFMSVTPLLHMKKHDITEVTYEETWSYSSYIWRNMILQ